MFVLIVEADPDTTKGEFCFEDCSTNGDIGASVTDKSLSLLIVLAQDPFDNVLVIFVSSSSLFVIVLVFSAEWAVSVGQRRV